MSQKPFVIAHRGASKHAPENTLPAFQLALDQGADGIELDVMLSKDKEIVVIHDDKLDRTTNGSGKVCDKVLAELRDLDAGLWFGETFRGTKVPTLEEVLAQFGGKYLINIELKNYLTPNDSLCERSVALVQKFGLQESVIFSSFNGRNLLRVRKADPSLKTGLLCLPGFFGALYRGAFGRRFQYDALHPYHKDVTERLVAKCQERGAALNVWTVNDTQDVLRMKTLGVDCLITDDPQGTRRILEN